MTESIAAGSRRLGIEPGALRDELVKLGVDCASLRTRVDPSMIDRAAATYRKRRRVQVGNTLPTTPRTLEILRRLALGETGVSIARVVGVTPQAVSYVRQRWAK